ncbi:sporulation protein [Pseudonocardia sp. H11422]|uniref:sporulation protein n=1 Tax=Pseudonocardia sp. H11422 TaxID=2835866 RepID=UPI001BDC5454|nr:sporulation protein [Pseudonocardia sp. H11422]
MDISELVGRADDLIRTNRVYADPLTADGLTLLPAARIRGGAGGGPQAQPDGAGAGLGWTGRPSGAFVIREGRVRWQPAVDVNRLIAAVAAVLITALLAARSIVRAQSQTAGRPPD